MRYSVPLLLSALLGCASFALQANVVINTTRIIYPGEAREVTATIDNPGKQPALVQTWIDSGDQIEVEYQDADFKKQKQSFSGGIAQIIQHEIDHCNGIII